MTKFDVKKWLGNVEKATQGLENHVLADDIQLMITMLRSSMKENAHLKKSMNTLSHKIYELEKAAFEADVLNPKRFDT